MTFLIIAAVIGCILPLIVVCAGLSDAYDATLDLQVELLEIAREDAAILEEARRADLKQRRHDAQMIEDIADLVRDALDMVVSTLQDREFDGMEAIDELRESFQGWMDSAEFERLCRENEADVAARDISGLWLHVIPEQYLAGFRSLEREVCVTSIHNGTLYSETRPVLVLRGTCRRLFPGNVSSGLTPNEKGQLDRVIWAQPPVTGGLDEGWLWVPTSTVVEVLVGTPAEKERVDALQLGVECHITNLDRTALWERFGIPTAQRGVTPRN